MISLEECQKRIIENKRKKTLILQMLKKNFACYMVK